MSELQQRINDDVKTAMRSKDKDRLGVLRLITAAFKQKEVDERIELDDTMVLAIMDKMTKQIRDTMNFRCFISGSPRTNTAELKDV